MNRHAGRVGPPGEAFEPKLPARERRKLRAVAAVLIAVGLLLVAACVGATWHRLAALRDGPPVEAWGQSVQTQPFEPWMEDGQYTRCRKVDIAYMSRAGARAALRLTECGDVSHFQEGQVVPPAQVAEALASARAARLAEKDTTPFFDTWGGVVIGLPMGLAFSAFGALFWWLIGREH
jgi:hypothetical protein